VIFLNLNKQIRKKDGQIEDFDINKFKKSLMDVQDGTVEQVVDFLVKEIIRRINDKFSDSNIISTQEIHLTTVDTLESLGYENFAYIYDLDSSDENIIPPTVQETDVEWSTPALEVMKHRYLRKDNLGNVVEDPEEMFWRVAWNIAQAEINYHKSPNIEEKAKKFYDMMIKREFMPNSPTIMNAGGELQMLSACFVIPIPDSMDGILDAAKAQGMIQKAGGGTGMSFGDLRPKGDFVGSTQGVSSGPVSFMHLFDAVTNTIKQGGKRRGANMGVLPIHHPDVLDFILCKIPGDQNKGKALENFNISVAITDEFMEKVKNGEDFDLINPRDNSVAGTVDARDLFGKIVYSAWATGDPGIIFIDRVNEDNFLPELGNIKSTNPCLTGDTWITTNDGPMCIDDIIGEKINILSDGIFYPSSSDGFFSNGVKEVYRITTKHGYEINATEDHLIFNITKQTRDKQYSQWTKVKDLEKGNLIKISNNKNITWKGNGTEDEGYLLGLLVGDGTIYVDRNKDRAKIDIWCQDKGGISMKEEVEKIAMKMPHRSDFNGFNLSNKEAKRYSMRCVSLTKLAAEYGLNSNIKTITKEIEQSSSCFYQGFLRGLFDADGTVLSSDKGNSVRLSQSNLPLLKAAQRMLLRLGVVSTVYKNRRDAQYNEWPDGNVYYSKAQHELVIFKNNIKVFADRIGFSNHLKQNKLINLLNNYKKSIDRERFSTEIVDIEFVGKKQVFDIQIPKVNSFSANGLIVHNCGEIPLHAWDACNLGAINLANHVDEEDGKYKINWKKLGRTVDNAINFLDNVVDMSEYPIFEIVDMVQQNRRIGLGIMGWHDVLIYLEIPYASDRGVALAEKVMDFISDRARDASSKLAEERGNFPNYEESLIPDLFGDIPMRNSYVNTIAPTGTTGILSGPIASGCEPYFGIVWHRNSMLTEEGVELLEVNPLFEMVAKREGFYSDKILNDILEADSIMDVDGIPKKWKDIFACSLDIPYEWHIKMQAGFQKYIDSAISKTINMKNDATKEDVENAYFSAWELGCKGITIYRDGSKNFQILNTGNNEKKNDNQENETSDIATMIKSSGGCSTCESV
jgi:ribonucleoside-diphosphate reductase alpha chain